MWVYLVGIALVLCILHIILNYNEQARLLRKIPGPQYDFLVGNGVRAFSSGAALMRLGREYAKTWNGIYRIWIPPFGAVLIYNPEDIETVISGTKYNDKSLIYGFLTPWLRDGLLLSSGSKWQERRKILTPAFHFNILRQYFLIIEENSQRFLDNLKQTAGKPIDIAPVLSEFTLSSICETAMGTQLNEDSGSGKSYKQAIYSLGYVIMHRFVRIYLYPNFIFNLTSLGRAQRHHLEAVHRFTKQVIQKRKAYVDKYGPNLPDDNIDDEVFVYKKKKKTAMLDLLISAEREGLIDKEGVQEEVDTFMFEGHDTTASGLTFCFLLLANHKDIQDKIVSELKEIFGDSKRAITMGDLSKMKYMECCIKESLRLYPPVHFISRNLTEATVLSNYTVPAGTLCHIPIIDLHRRADLFPDPEKFDPDRFLPENSVGRHTYSYIPFSAGPRNCIGQKFAMMEMKIAIAEVLRQFELQPVTRPSDIVFMADLVLRNEGPVLVQFVERH
ncbi:unnamed protein product [Arctia plantaginis]|uniref:Cytochrome P450 n=1 Tax=Arctia plantaginis TaxID=874455 RepID=A0A8S1BC73_ARCPL|nr:unnamed protein product [Arctia plantaginis]